MGNPPLASHRFGKMTMTKLSLSTGIILLCFANTVRAKETYTGTWETTYGVMTLKQTGVRVEGTYLSDGSACTIEGQVEKKRLMFRYEEADEKGEGWFELSADGRSFDGKWRVLGEKAWQEWHGKRVTEVPPAQRGFEGLWETSYGRMRLIQDNDDVHGIYAYNAGSSIGGQRTGKKLTFTYKEPDAAGEGWFELAADGKSFQGKWKAKGAPNWSDWTGKRVDPVLCKVWLVVIEANWESHLGEQEYLFGNMLRAFFARAPQVQVRQRIFHDEDGLRKWCREVAYLAEPVLLSVATHGCAKGVTVDGKVIGATAMADSLRYATNLKLLHFSACELMKERVAADMMLALTKHARFPISGYTTSVDWAASALIEFTYFDLILSRNIDPARAAEQLPRLVPYAGDKTVAGSAYPAAGFRFLAPDAKK